MQLSTLDWAILLAFFVILLSIGFFASKKAGKSVNEFTSEGKKGLNNHKGPSNGIDLILY